jgi:DNA topoisomerase-2
VFYTMPQYAQWAKATGAAKGWAIKYYKGLGTSSSAEAKDYFRAIHSHRKTFEYTGADSDACIQLAFDKTKANERKAWLEAFVQGTHMDSVGTSLTYPEFVNKELILFSMADNVRSIPSCVDGLKPSQRKVLFACFRRKLTAEIKVAQLAGYVSEHTMYHHGEQSLASTIVGMAQNFVGSNNINLLYPSGQFGTRLMGGADAASPRYIFTRLSCITRLIFHEADDGLLECHEEDGVAIEPKFYVPVIPMVLVNGSEGIGTGWSSSVPTFNPMDVIAALRRKLAGAAPVPLLPWFRGFGGTVVVKDSKHCATRGKVLMEDGSSTLSIRELPVGKWTQSYKEFLEGRRRKPGAADESGGFIASIKEGNTDTIVRFDVQLAPSALPCADADIVKLLQLEAPVSLTNMHLFNAEGKIEKYVYAVAWHGMAWHGMAWHVRRCVGMCASLCWHVRRQVRVGRSHFGGLCATEIALL